jgi:hypothetical protein
MQTVLINGTILNIFTLPVLHTSVAFVDYLVRHYEGVSKSFRTGRLGRELQMVQLSATRFSCIAPL